MDNPRGPSRGGTTRGRQLAVAAGFLVALVIAEGAARLRESGVEFLADERLYRSSPGQHGTNSDGFHERDGLPIEAGDRRRIAVLGDSMTWGQGEASETWTKKAEDALGPPWEVLNFARYGSDTRQQAATLPEVWPYQPELLLIGVYWNDAIPNRMVEVGSPATPVWLGRRGGLWPFSAAYRAVHGLWHARGYHAETEVGFVGRELANIRELAVERGVATAVVLLWPHALARGVADCASVSHRENDCLYAKKVTEMVAGEAVAAGYPVLDTLPALREPTWPANHSDWEHPGPEADARVGAWVAANLRETGLIADK